MYWEFAVYVVPRTNLRQHASLHQCEAYWHAFPACGCAMKWSTPNAHPTIPEFFALTVHDNAFSSTGILRCLPVSLTLSRFEAYKDLFEHNYGRRYPSVWRGKGSGKFTLRNRSMYIFLTAAPISCAVSQVKRMSASMLLENQGRMTIQASKRLLST